MPDVGDGIVIYQDKRDGNCDISASHLKSGTERRLATNTANQTSPQIGDYRSVVYQNDRAGPPDLYAKTSTRTNHRSPNDPAASEPTLQDPIVSWHDARSDARDFYLAESCMRESGSSLRQVSRTRRHTVDLRTDRPPDRPLRERRRPRRDRLGSGQDPKIKVVPVDRATGSCSVTLRNMVPQGDPSRPVPGGLTICPTAPARSSVRPEAREPRDRRFTLDAEGRHPWLL